MEAQGDPLKGGLNAAKPLLTRFCVAKSVTYPPNLPDPPRTSPKDPRHYASKSLFRFCGGGGLWGKFSVWLGGWDLHLVMLFPNDKKWKPTEKTTLVFGRSDCGQGGESFRPPFSKGGAVKGAEPLSRSAERDTLLWRFLFAKLFLCAYMVKEKASFGIVLFWGDNTFCLQPEPTEKTHWFSVGSLGIRSILQVSFLFRCGGMRDQVNPCYSRYYGAWRDRKSGCRLMQQSDRFRR